MVIRDFAHEKMLGGNEGTSIFLELNKVDTDVSRTVEIAQWKLLTTRECTGTNDTKYNRVGIQPA